MSYPTKDPIAAGLELFGDEFSSADSGIRPPNCPKHTPRLHMPIEPPFDDSDYLTANQDVAAAVAEGRVRSAWSHYASFGFDEHRNGVADRIQMKVKAAMNAVAPPHPPLKLVSRVHGSSDASGFERVGRRVALDIYSAASSEIDLEAPLKILDFGCGCGRVLPYMEQLAPSATFIGTDIDSEAIDWCRANFGEEVKTGRFNFIVNQDAPPLPYSEGYFDFVYGISVFTHLPEDMQLLWLNELARITRRGGILVLSTTGGELIHKHLSEVDRLSFAKKGFYYFPFGGTDGLPDHYQAAWHNSAYINKVWSKYFDILKQIPGGIADHQDLILARK